MPGVPDVAPGNWQLSHNNPVAQRWCGEKPRSLAVKLSTATGPVTLDCVTIGQTPLPVTEHRFTRTCVPLMLKSAGASLPLWVIVWVTLTLSSVTCLTLLLSVMLF